MGNNIDGWGEGGKEKDECNNKLKLTGEEKGGAHDNIKWIIHRTHCPSRFP